MLAQYRSGDVHGALESFAESLSLFRDQLGLDPAPSLVKLHRAILSRDPRLDHPDHQGGWPIAIPLRAGDRVSRSR